MSKTRIILVCSAGASLLAHEKLIGLMKAAEDCEAVERIVVEVDGMGSYNGMEFGGMHIDEARDIERVALVKGSRGEFIQSRRVHEVEAGLDYTQLFDLPKDVDADRYLYGRWEEDKPVPHVHADTRKPSKSKAKSARPMIRRTC